MGNKRAWALAVLSSGWAGCSFSVRGLDPVDAGVNSYVCACDCTTAAPRVLDLAIANGDDDAEENLATNLVTLVSDDLDLGVEGAPITVGLRFRDLGVPPGSTILAASLQFTVDVDTHVEPTTLQLQGERIDPARPTEYGLPFVATNGNLSARPPTTATVPWTVPAWPIAGVSGADQRSPSLAPLLQALVSDPLWSATRPLVFLIKGTGHREAVSFNARPAGAVRLHLEYQEPTVTLSPQVCVPPALNPNLPPRPAVSDDQIAADCQQRVENTVRGLASSCGYPGSCSCTFKPASRSFAPKCDETCQERPLAAGCRNFDPKVLADATNAPGDTPVCVASSPLTAALFGRSSTCLVAGQARVVAGDESKTTAARGVLELKGPPCPGASCGVALAQQLSLDPITFESTFSSATFQDLSAFGASLPGGEVLLTPAGTGAVARNSLAVAARGRRGSDTRGVSGTNDDVVNLTVGWGAPAMCSLKGALLGAADPELKRCESAGPDADKVCAADADCTSDPACSDGVCNCQPLGDVNLTLALDLEGPIVNQPPTANGGPDQTIECNLPGRARFTLDGTASTDPDANIRLVSWRAGSRTGAEVGFTPRPVVEQALGTVVPYVLRVIDAHAQADEDTAVAHIVDTTAPTIACNAPPTITPPSAPITFTGSATDICDAAVAAQVTGFDCFTFTKNGKRIDKTHSCAVAFTGGALTVTDSGGVGDHISWTLRAVDDSGNVAAAACEVVVVRP